MQVQDHTGGAFITCLPKDAAILYTKLALTALTTLLL